MHSHLFITIRTVLCYLYKYIYTGTYTYTKLGGTCIIGLQSILHNIFKYPTLGMYLCALQYYANPLNHQEYILQNMLKESREKHIVCMYTIYVFDVLSLFKIQDIYTELTVTAFKFSDYR